MPVRVQGESTLAEDIATKKHLMSRVRSRHILENEHTGKPPVDGAEYHAEINHIGVSRDGCLRRGSHRPHTRRSNAKRRNNGCGYATYRRARIHERREQVIRGYWLENA